MEQQAIDAELREGMQFAVTEQATADLQRLPALAWVVQIP
jgi:hypothetical protein